MTLVKLCGFTRSEDARVAAEAGVDMLGVILWPGTPRGATSEQAAAIRQAAPEVELVGVFVDEGPERIDELIEQLGLDWVQLHGHEPAEVVERYRGRCIRGVRDGDASGVPAGIPVLYDRPFGEHADADALAAHWRAAASLAGDVMLAGRLDPDNVAAAVRAVHPWAVDSASGIEQAPGIKDHERIRRFVTHAREAI